MENYDSMYKGNARAEIKSSSRSFSMPSSMYSNRSGNAMSYNPSQAEFYMQKQPQEQQKKNDYHLQKDVGGYKMPGVALKIAMPIIRVSF